MTKPDGAGFIAERTFEQDGKQLVLRIERPMRDPDAKHGEWTCRVLIRRHGGTEEFTASGEDSLQALIVAVASLRKVLREELPSLSWLGEQGLVGLPIVTQGYDREETEFTELLLETEARRRGLWMRDAMRFASRSGENDEDDD